MTISGVGGGQFWYFPLENEKKSDQGSNRDCKNSAALPTSPPDLISKNQAFLVGGGK